MASQSLEDFLQSASPEDRQKLEQLSQHLQSQNVKAGQSAPIQSSIQTEQAPVDRADSKQINQEWQQGKDVKIETVSEKSDLQLADSQIPRNGQGRTGGYDPPKFMDEPRLANSSLGLSPVGEVQTDDAKRGHKTQTVPQSKEHQISPVHSILAADANRKIQAQTAQQENTPTQRKEQEPER